MPLPEGQRVEVLAEFPAEQAGELVGWSHFEINERDVIFGAIAYARVGDEGARFSLVVDEDGSQYRNNDSITGFNRTVELGFNAIAAQDDLAAQVYLDGIRSPHLIPADDSTYRGDDLPFGTRLFLGPEVAKGEWSVGEDAILETIKRQMRAEDINWLYSMVYYNLAYLADEADILADPDMSMETSEVSAQATDYVDALRRVQAEDQTMARDLTVFGNVTPDKIPSAFAASRRKVGEIERGLAAKQKVSAVNSWQLPVGFRPSGRTWPYMDPTEADEDRAFGRELTDLRKKDTTSASVELEKELAEIRHRITRANALSDRLGALASREIAKAKELS